MGISKVVLGEEVKLDLTSDTVTAETLLEGYTAHGADGEAITGTYKGGGGGADYFGDGSDGDLTIATEETYTVQVIEDAESAILNLKSLTIDWGGTLTTSGRCEGLFIKVKGDCTINGTILMDKKAPLEPANDADLAQNPCILLLGSPVGGAGGAGANGYNSSYGSTNGGAGGEGYVFGGGSGGGGGGASGYAPAKADRAGNGSDGTRAPVGVTWPYQNNPPLYGGGGYGDTKSYPTLGGAAPGGSGGRYGAKGTDGDAYGGGAIYLFVNGKLTIGTTGVLSANGGNGAAGSYGGGSPYTDDTSTYYAGPGGGGGGGIICVVYNSTIVNGGKLSVSGGVAGTQSYAKYTATDGSVGFTKVVAFSTLQS